MNYVREEDVKNIIHRIPYKELENKKVLITGANGFMASYLVDTLMYLNQHKLVKGCKIIALCRNQEKAEYRFGEYLQHPCFTLWIQDVEEKISLKERVDYIFHAAGSSATGKQKIVPVDILKSNMIGTYQLLEYAKEQEVSSFLFFSSGAVYGENKPHMKEITERDIGSIDFSNPQNCYVEGKRAGEALCASYWTQHGVPAKSVRIGHTYGPGIDLEDGHVYSDFVKSICKGENLNIKGDGQDVRPFCYVTDAVVAFILILLYGENGEAYNMVNRGENYSIRDLAEKLVKEAFPEKHLLIECKNASDKQGDKSEVNTDKLEKLGWTATIDVVEGFRRTVKSFESEKR